jgi:hypothetical protein
MLHYAENASILPKMTQTTGNHDRVRCTTEALLAAHFWPLLKIRFQRMTIWVGVSIYTYSYATPESSKQTFAS